MQQLPLFTDEYLFAHLEDEYQVHLGSDRVCALVRCWSSVGVIPTRQLGRSSR